MTCSEGLLHGLALRCRKTSVIHPRCAATRHLGTRRARPEAYQLYHHPRRGQDVQCRLQCRLVDRCCPSLRLPIALPSIHALAEMAAPHPFAVSERRLLLLHKRLVDKIQLELVPSDVLPLCCGLGKSSTRRCEIDASTGTPLLHLCGRAPSACA